MSGISIRSLHKSFGKVEALRDINLEIDQGEFIALIGPSGCGKTTLLRTCLGLERPTKGTVLLGGQDAVAARKAKDLGIVFQKPALVPSRTSLSNVQITLDITGVKDHLDPNNLLEEFGLGSFKNHYPHQLSGGMQQRVNLAAAMVHNPHYLMMDEPFGALDERDDVRVGGRRAASPAQDRDPRHAFDRRGGHARRQDRHPGAPARQDRYDSTR